MRSIACIWSRWHCAAGLFRERERRIDARYERVGETVRILFVDDEFTESGALKKTLSAVTEPMVELDYAQSVRDALAKIGSDRFDPILLDNRPLPNVDFRQTVPKLRAASYTGPIGVISMDVSDSYFQQPRPWRRLSHQVRRRARRRDAATASSAANMFTTCQTSGRTITTSDASLYRQADGKAASRLGRGLQRDRAAERGESVHARPPARGPAASRTLRLQAPEGGEYVLLMLPRDARPIVGDMDRPLRGIGLRLDRQPTGSIRIGTCMSLFAITFFSTSHSPRCPHRFARRAGPPILDRRLGASTEAQFAQICPTSSLASTS